MAPWWGMNDLVRTLIGVAAGLLFAWLALLVTMLLLARDRVRLSDAIRLLPDLLRLVARLARDSTLPSGVRLRLWLLLGYLALPLDLVPDFIPVIGYADDAVVTLLVLRSVAHRAGPDAISRHWPGTPVGLDAVLRLTQ
jgi:uncharacterized membrane protein YkvA (DUF1232 family)